MKTEESRVNDESTCVGRKDIDRNEREELKIRKCGMAYIVVIASAYKTEDPGFESRQGVRVFRNLHIAVQLS
jgi:hypothetical protein